MAEEFRSMTSGAGVFDAEPGAAHAGASAPAEGGRLGSRGIPGGRNTVVMGSMALVALACVWGLSRGAGGPATADAKQALIEQQVDCAVKVFDSAGKPDSGPVVRADDVAKSFYYQATERQVPLGQLQGNPFVYKPPVAHVEPGPSTRPADPNAQAAPKRPAPSAAKLVLQSVLVGSHGRAAMISNNLLTKGQQLDGWTLTEVNPRSVVMEADGVKQTLTMAD